MDNKIEHFKKVVAEIKYPAKTTLCVEKEESGEVVGVTLSVKIPEDEIQLEQYIRIIDTYE